LSFGEEDTDPTVANQYVLSQVIYPSGMRYTFTYKTSGELEQITYPVCGKSRYFYTGRQVLDRILNQTVWEHFVTSHDTGPGTSIWSWANGVPAGQTAPSLVSITIPGGTNISHYMDQGSPGWADGLLTKTVEAALQEIRQDWEQDDSGLNTIFNPRVVYRDLVMKGIPPTADKTVHTEFSYAPLGEFSGNVKEIREYSFGGALRRKTVFGYLHEDNPAYAPLNILDRVNNTWIFNGSGTLVAHTFTAYDYFSPLYTASGAIRHDPAFGPTYTLRGLPSVVQKLYDVPGSLYVTTQTKYDECGNPREVIDPKLYTTLTYFWLSTSDNAYAFPLKVVNPKGHETKATYSYFSGAVLTQTDANNQVTSMTYDSWDRVTQIIRSDGGKTTYAYNNWAQCDAVPPLTPSVTVTEDVTATTDRIRKGEVDNQGRLKEQTLTDPVGGDIEQANTYDGVSRLSQREVAHRAGQTPEVNTYTYQGLSYRKRPP
jgi:YD repeat-containing protein